MRMPSSSATRVASSTLPSSWTWARSAWSCLRSASSFSRSPASSRPACARASPRAVCHRRRAPLATAAGRSMADPAAGAPSRRSASCANHFSSRGPMVLGEPRPRRARTFSTVGRVRSFRIASAAALTSACCTNRLRAVTGRGCSCGFTAYGTGSSIFQRFRGAAPRTRRSRRRATGPYLPVISEDYRS